MDLGLLTAFVLVDLLLVLTPGADWSYAIATGLRGASVVPSIAGLLSGYVLHAALVAAGVGGLLASDATALHVLTFAGAAYLLWLGVSVARRPPELVAGTSTGALRGAAVSGLNPKGLLLFFAVLPQFVSAGAAWPVGVQLAVLGAAHVALCGAVYLTVALVARRVLRARPRAAHVVGRASGGAMIAVAVALTGEQLLA